MSKKIIPQYCDAADLLVIAALEWRAGNKKDALTVAAGALNHPSMIELAAAMNIFNKAAKENTSIEEIIGEGQRNKSREEINPQENIEDDITPAVSSVMERILQREYSAGTVSPEDEYSGPGGDEENDDILSNIDEEENPESGTPEEFGDMDTDADINDLLQNGEEEDQPDPANPDEMEEHPAEAAIIDDDNEISVEDNNNDDLPPKTTKFNDKVARLGPDLRAIANRLSIKGDKEGRAIAAAVIKSRRTA